MEKKEISFEESMELDKAVEYLEAVVSALKEGEYVIEKEGDSLSFGPQGPVKLEVEVKHKKGSQELEIELSWKPEGAEEEEEEEENEEEDEDKGEEEGEPEEPEEPEREEAAPPGTCRGKAGIAKALSIAGLAAAGAAIFSLTRRKRADKAEEATDSAAEEKADAEQGEESAEPGEKAPGKGRNKVRELLKR